MWFLLSMSTLLSLASGSSGGKPSLAGTWHFVRATSYFGRYTVDAAAGTVTHRVAASLDPTDAGEKKREFTLSGDELVLSGSWVYRGETIRFEITWRREPNRS